MCKRLSQRLVQCKTDPKADGGGGLFFNNQWVVHKRWHGYSLHVHMVFEVVGKGLC